MSHRNKEPVLVSDVESVNGTDGVIPSTMRLYIAHEEFEEIGSGDVYLYPQRIFKVITAGINRELSPLPVAGREQASNRFKPRMVEAHFKL